MEVKINREIRNYTESIFFGLSLRQFIFSVFACGVAVLLYFLLKGKFGIETLSWVCILGASPFAALGFLTYNGMTAEKFIWAWLKSEFLVPKQLTFKPTNFYYELLKDEIEKLMNELDGKEVHKNDWKALVFDELEYIARDSEGTTYPINKYDVEEVERISTKKDDRGCR